MAITEHAEPEPVVEMPAAHPAARTTAARAHDLVMRLGSHLDRFKARAPRVIALLRVVYLPVAIALVAYIGWRAGRKIDFSTVRIWALALAYLAALAWWIALALGWSTLITERFHRAQFDAWCKTQVTRYLPGGIWAPLTRATTVQGRIRDKATAVVAENAIVACAALGVGALWACVHQQFYLLLVVMLFVPTLGARWLEQRSKVTKTAIVRTTGLYSAGYICYGVSALLTQIAVSGVRDPTYPLYVAGAACIAWVVGLVVVFAPGGVGVREVVYIWLLHGLYPHAELQAAAVVARLVTVLAELTVLTVISVRFTGKSQAAVT